MAMPPRNGLPEGLVVPSTVAAAAAGFGQSFGQGQPIMHASGASGATADSSLQQPLEQQLQDPAQAAAQAAAAAAEAAAAAAEAQRQRREEDGVLVEAGRIKATRGALKVAPCPEPKRGKTHWDCLLEEMTWLAKEFAKERQWKLKHAKKYALAVQRSEKDLESRVLVRAREEEKALIRRAAWVAKEVMGFWSKAQRVVGYKVRSEAAAKKKEVMDKQLDFLLGQTQKYSTMLAGRLKGEEAAAAAAVRLPPSLAPAPSGLPPTCLSGSLSGSPLPAAGAPKPEPEAAAAAPSGAGSGGDHGGQAAAQPSRRQRRPTRGVSPALPASAAASGTAAAGDDSADYRSGEDDDADNEATIEEEEALAQAEGRDVQHEEADEVAGLDEEADLPLEQLLARYGNYHLAAHAESGGEEPGCPAAGSQAGGADQPVKMEGLEHEPAAEGEQAPAADEEQQDGEDGEEGEEEDGTAVLLERDGLDLAADGEGTAVLLEQEEQLQPAASGVAAAADGAAGPSQQAAAAEGEEEEEEEYRGDEDHDADNEATIEEEEALAQAEGRDVQHEEADEVAGLDEEADLPLEQLLARYGNYHLAAHAGSDAAAAEAAAGGAVKVEEPPSAPTGPSATQAAAADAAAGAAAAGAVRAGLQAGEEAEAEGDPLIKGENEEERMGNAIAAMAELQPMGTTLATAQIQTKSPFLIKGTLREYQQIGLDWLVTLYHKRLNGILADEMGLGKTIQTIALLAHLACEKGDWGPHLVVVPTSVMLNWEMEFKKWSPAFKLLTYYGSVKERAAKRQGWSKPNAFHVCITSYTLVLQDARMFKRKKWKYLILDEAHMIKNWKSQRWQTLLNFNSKRRLLITGTPLQNDLMELWSLMHFLMPQVFGSHAQFKDWFSNPLTGMVEGSAEMNRAIVERLHAVLRPFLLRRLKKDVEKQLPQKHEHIIYCRLSSRQRKLYEEYMASGNTRATLASGNFLGIMNCLMQLRKVCNHPDLFEGRPIVSAYDMQVMKKGWGAP
ncbi:Protein PHOTOPERIOD-INDEPENDENT EARLY FLOWERING 1 [Chlorella vulgaris]